MRLRLVVVSGLFLLAGCTPSSFTVFVSSDAQPAVASFFSFLPEANAKVVTSSNPSGDVSAGKGSGVRVALVADLTCGDCYKLSGGDWSYQVHAGNPLGLQYGLAELLEACHFRFFHPWASKVPSTFASPDKAGVLGKDFNPTMTLRGVHFHTLHPIEPYFAFWNPGASNLQDAKRIIDWVVKNRGNYVEWSGLNNIVPAGSVQDAWRAQTQAIVTYAHERGIQVGFAPEMFGTANAQLAFDFLDTQTEPDPQAVIDQRLGIFLNSIPFDKVDISFGEFSGTDPNVFLTALNLIDQEVHKIAPTTEFDATIHMDNSSGLQVTYDGQTVPYYFLVQFANPDIVPWIHSVMYFDLFQPADGAYDYQNFDLHLGYLQSRLKASQPVAYYPESAYWIAFDDSVPTYLPLYMRSRWLDMNQLSAQAAQGGYSQLAQHVEFSSGFEWNYWQNDYATLRMNFTLPAQWGDEVQTMFAPWGSQGQKLAAQITALGELQNTMLIQDALAAYIAGRDALIDYGAMTGVISQPDRVALSDMVTMDASVLAQFQQDVIAPLATLASQTQAIQSAISSIGLSESDPWISEVSDGVRVDVDRATFVHALYAAVANHIAQQTDGGWLAKANAALADATATVAHRHSHMHYPRPTDLTERSGNSTLYQYGYLYEADTLCYWQRELIQARAILVGDQTQVPACVL